MLRNDIYTLLLQFSKCLVFIACGTVVGCFVDTSPLDERRCGQALDCPQGSECVGSYCQVQRANTRDAGEDVPKDASSVVSPDSADLIDITNNTLDTHEQEDSNSTDTNVGDADVFDADSGNNAECVRDDDCLDPDEICDTSTNTCLTSECGRCPVDWFCDEGTDECWQCALDEDCSLNQECRTADHICVESRCATDSDCSPTQYCNLPTGQCTASCREDLAEPNNNLNEATILFEGLLSGLSICENDDDWFRLVLGEGDSFEVRMLFSHNEGNLDLVLVNSANELLAISQSTSDDELIVYTALTNGVYYARVYGVGGATASYELNVIITHPACNDDGFEPNDSNDEAQSLNPASYPNLAICPNNEDWYSLALIATDHVTINIDFDHARGDLSLDLYRPDGTRILAQSDSSTDNETIDYPSLPESGLYLLRVFGASSETSNAYSLDIVHEPSCANDGFEHNDVLTSATHLELGEYTDLVMCQSDDDWYEVNVDSLASITAFIQFINADNDLNLEILNEAGETIAFSMGTSDEEEAVTEPSLVGGLVYVHVYSSRFSSPGLYELTLSSTTLACGDGGDCPFPLVCNPVGEQCVQCLEDNDCSGACDTNVNQCVECLNDDDCDEFQICNDDLRRCVECINDSDCVGDGQCLFDPRDRDSKICGECTSNAECPGQTCHPISRYCVPVAEAPCDEDVDCMPGRFCDTGMFGEGSGVCINSDASCISDRDCRPEHQCRFDTLIGNRCTGCSFIGCPVGQFCVPIFNICESTSVEPEAPAVGGLIITEILYDPHGELAEERAEWIELYNTSMTPLTLDGCTVKDESASSNPVLLDSLVVEPEGYLLLSRSATNNGGLIPDRIFFFALNNAGESLTVRCGELVIDVVSYDDGGAFPDASAASIALKPNEHTASANDLGANWCLATEPYYSGNTTHFGTPKAPNSCP